MFDHSWSPYIVAKVVSVMASIVVVSPGISAASVVVVAPEITVAPVVPPEITVVPPEITVVPPEITVAPVVLPEITVAPVVPSLVAVLRALVVALVTVEVPKTLVLASSVIAEVLATSVPLLVPFSIVGVSAVSVAAPQPPHRRSPGVVARMVVLAAVVGGIEEVLSTVVGAPVCIEVLSAVVAIVVDIAGPSRK